MKKKGRYQQKADQGLVPHRYDRDSKSFREGAWKNWPHARDDNRNITATMPMEARSDCAFFKNDKHALMDRQTRYHQFTM